MNVRALCVISALLLPAAAVAADADAVLKRASAAMGADRINTIRYAGTGSAWQFGQAFSPGKVWPKLDLPSYSLTIDYQAGAFREDIVRKRAEPTGGGGIPPTWPNPVEQKLSQFVSGTHAWNQIGPAPAASPRHVTERTHELWITPHGVLKAAAKAQAAVDWRMLGGKEYAAVSFSVPGVFSATAYINDDWLVERVESRVPNHVLGDTAVVTQYEGYRDHGGVKFPSRIRQSSAGFPVLEIDVKEVEPNARADIPVPPTVSGFVDRVAVEEAAPGVWYVAGGTHHSVAIEMRDHLILVESPLFDGRATAVLDAVHKLAPKKPIRYVIASHTHFDHAGGLRAAAAEGATVIAQGSGKVYYERVFANANRISPDRLAKSGRKAKVMGFGDKLVLSDGKRAIELYHIKDGPHVDNFLMVYLPKERLLIEADAFTPGPAGAKPPSPVNVNNANLVENIERRQLVVERVLPLHGRMVPAAELWNAVGRTK
jgi:glyoxylase-like metal-dependent hydrolase (beta-lactamase superfamily II)